MVVPLGCAPATMPSNSCQSLSAPRMRAAHSGPENSVIASGYLPAGKWPRSLKEARPVGIGPKVLVSVAREALKTRMGLSLWLLWECSFQAAAAVRRRCGPSISAVSPKAAMRSGSGSPRASAAQASPIAADVWMP